MKESILNLNTSEISKSGKLTSAEEVCWLCVGDVETDVECIAK